MMEFLYKANDLKNSFGENYVGPDILPHAQEVRVAVFEPSTDGFKVEVYCTAMPANFYTIKALPTPNSVGEERDGFVLSTGSGQLLWTAITAESIADGMVGCDGLLPKVD